MLAASKLECSRPSPAASGPGQLSPRFCVASTCNYSEAPETKCPINETWDKLNLPQGHYTKSRKQYSQYSREQYSLALFISALLPFQSLSSGKEVQWVKILYFYLSNLYGWRICLWIFPHMIDAFTILPRPTLAATVLLLPPISLSFRPPPTYFKTSA